MAGQLIKIPIGIGGGATLLDVAVIACCVVGLAKLRFKLKKPPLFVKAALLFILVALLSLILTPLNLEPIQYFTSLSYTLRFSLYILLGWLIFSGAFPSIRKQIPQLLLFSGAGLAIAGLLQFIFLPDLMFLQKYGWDPHYFRAASTFLDPNFLGSYLVLTLLLLTHTTFPHSKFPFIITYLALLTTFSRGAYLAFLVSFLYLSVLQKSVRLGVITLLLFGVLLLGFTTYQKLVAQPRGIDRSQSAEFRLGTWQQGWKLFSQHPILGIGFNSYKFALREYNLGDEEFLKSHGASTNDSSFLYVAATTGTIGIITYILFLGSFFYIRNYLLTAGLIGLISQSFFANTLFFPPLLIWIILLSTTQKK